MPCLSSSAVSALKESIRVSNAASQLAVPFMTTTFLGSSANGSPKGSAVCTAGGGAAGVCAVAGGGEGAADGLATGAGVAAGAGAAGVGVAAGVAAAASGAGAAWGAGVGV